MGYTLSQWFWSLGGELLVAIIVGGLAMSWGLFEGVKRWSAAVNGIVVMAAIFLMINQSGWWEPPVKVKIHQWLDELSISVKEEPITDTSNFDFKFECIAEADIEPIQEYRFNIKRPKHHGNGFIVMESGYSMSASFKNWKNLESGRKAALMRKFKIDLSMKGANYTFTDDTLTLRYLIPVSSLSFDQLVKGYTTLTDSNFIVSNTLGLALE